MLWSNLARSRRAQDRRAASARFHPSGVGIVLSLLLKIFFAYWVAAGVVIIFSDLQPHRLIHTPEMSDALDTSLDYIAQSLIAVHEDGSCPHLDRWNNQGFDAIDLLSADGRILCGNFAIDGLGQLIDQASKERRRLTRAFARYQIIATPVLGWDQRRYTLLLRSRYTSTIEVYGFLPGIRTLQISVMVTSLLAVLIVLPLRQLSEAARRMADGDLDARVSSGILTRVATSIGLRDGMDGLKSDFNTMAGRLQSLVNAQKLLLRDVSHELRSPLARLAVALELIRDEVRETAWVEIHSHLNRIESESVRLNALIGHVLSFSYIDTISELHHSEDLSLSDVIEELLPDVQYEAESRGCRIVHATPNDFTLKGDSYLLRHAVENIVRNAIRYSPPGGTVEIEVAAQEANGRECAVIRVSDEGPGVEEDKLSLILNPFYRINSCRRGSTSGFGVGLAMADRAAHLHSGHILARNRQGGGLVVEMSLPLPRVGSCA